MLRAKWSAMPVSVSVVNRSQCQISVRAPRMTCGHRSILILIFLDSWEILFLDIYTYRFTYLRGGIIEYMIVSAQ